MRIAPQVQAEVAVILGGVFGLGLRAQHHFIHQRFGIVALDCASTRLNSEGATRRFWRTADRGFSRIPGGYEPSQASAHRAPGR